MSKNYDLYPNYERKIDNWRRRILGYEKMKRDLQRQIKILKNKNRKQKETIDKAITYIEKFIPIEEDTILMRESQRDYLLEILQGVSK